MNEYTYSEENKGLTYDQAIELLGQGKKVRCENPYPEEAFKNFGVLDMLLLDLCERKGWPMTEVSEADYKATQVNPLEGVILGEPGSAPDAEAPQQDASVIPLSE